MYRIIEATVAKHEVSAKLVELCGTLGARDEIIAFTAVAVPGRLRDGEQEVTIHLIVKVGS